MKTLDLMRLAFDRSLLFAWLIMAPMLLIVGFTPDRGAHIVGLLVTAGPIGFFRLDVARFRLYGITRATARGVRIFGAALFGLAIVVLLVPGFILSESAMLLWALGGVIIGLLIQLLRNPEAAFDGASDFALKGTTASGLVWDIIFKPTVWFLLVGPILAASTFIMPNQGMDNLSEIGPGLMGMYGALLGGQTSRLHDGYRVWKTYGKDSASYLKYARWIFHAEFLLIFISFYVLVLVRFEGSTVTEFLAMCAVGLYVEAAVFIGAFRKFGLITPLVLFIGMFALNVIVAIFMDNATVQWWIIGTVILFWIVALYGYVPWRIRTHKFGTSGFRAMMGVKDQIAL